MQKGFTLIELLVVISIITILSVVGLVSFQNVRKSANDAKIKADLNAIKKAYETNFDPSLNGGQGGYKQLTPSNFANNQIPTQPNGSPYPYVYGPNAASPKTDGYKVTATFSDGATSTSVISNQGTRPASQLNACDSSGTLSNGLVGYWKMDDNFNDSSSGGNNGIDVGTVLFTTGEKGKAADFDSGGKIMQLSSDISVSGSAYSISAWSYFPLPGSDWRTLTRGRSYDHQVLVDGGGIVGVYDNAGSSGFHSSGYNTNSLSGWHMLTAVASDTSTVFYIDGNTIPAGTSDFKSNAQISSIGNSYYGGQNWGKLDETRIYNRVLSASEITALYNDGLYCP